MVFMYFRWKDDLAYLHINIECEWGYLYKIDPETKLASVENDMLLMMPIHLEFNNRVSSWFDMYHCNRFTMQRFKINRDDRVIFEKMYIGENELQTDVSHLQSKGIQLTNTHWESTKDTFRSHQTDSQYQARIIKDFFHDIETDKSQKFFNLVFNLKDLSFPHT
ncbi:hypothetical protein CYY_000986 [Polysphondylium violaceum]|uniref:Uncharacterized protein n=1 Tax=Polysphondylium violaceum TaxID=133409 RepID=A0A8J4Q3Z6_9MYCE|nr:hypothetical protein CYY_000986 [Polysphondylium violaceum]